MSDTKLRDLERRWKETQSVEDEAAYLLERVRVGDLTRERLELAAYCGHEGARRAIGRQELTPRVDLLQWTRALPEGTDHHLTLVVVALLAASFVQDLWRSEFPQDHSPEKCLDAVAAWVRSAGQDSVAEVREAACTATNAWRNEMYQQVERGAPVTNRRSAAWRAGAAAAQAGTVVYVSDRRREGRAKELAIETIREALGGPERLGHDPASASTELLTAIREATAGWALSGRLVLTHRYSRV